MRRAPLVLALISCAACLAHEDDAIAPAIEPIEPARRADTTREAPPIAAARPVADDAEDAEPAGEASLAPAAPDPDDRDGPIPPTAAGRPSVGASLPADAEIARQALALGEAGKGDDMRKTWLELVREHPTSAYVPLAYATFGDHYFAQGDFETASRFYEKTLQFPDAPIRAWATYKLAWCKLRAGDGVGALERFVQTLRAVDDGHAGSTADAEVLAAATRRDLVLAYAEVGKPARAAAFFQRLAGGAATDEVPPAGQLDLLGRHLTRDGRTAEAATICDALKAADPRAVCDW